MHAVSMLFIRLMSGNKWTDTWIVNEALNDFFILKIFKVRTCVYIENNQCYVIGYKTVFLKMTR
jgi:hypothetical protein